MSDDDKIFLFTLKGEKNISLGISENNEIIISDNLQSMDTSSIENQLSELNIEIQDLKDSVNIGSAQGILMNPYFKINTRGYSTYTSMAAHCCVDFWEMAQTQTGTAKITSTGITLTGPITIKQTLNNFIDQLKLNSKDLVLIADINSYSGSPKIIINNNNNFSISSTGCLCCKLSAAPTSISIEVPQGSNLSLNFCNIVINGDFDLPYYDTVKYIDYYSNAFSFNNFGMKDYFNQKEICASSCICPHSIASSAGIIMVSGIDSQQYKCTCLGTGYFVDDSLDTVNLIFHFPINHSPFNSLGKLEKDPSLGFQFLLQKDMTSYGPSIIESSVQSGSNGILIYTGTVDYTNLSKNKYSRNDNFLVLAPNGYKIAVTSQLG